MKDVAEAAGVSVATVSRVLSGRGGVAPAKSSAVQRACRTLGYRPDGLAAALRTRSSSSIGVLVPDLTNPFFPAVVQTLQYELAQSALDVLLCDSDNDVGVEMQRLETLLRRRVDALLVCPVHARRSVPALRSAARATRLLQLDRRAIDEADFVGADQSAGMAQIAEHLARAGADSAVFVGAHRGMSSIIEREQGFRTACKALSLATWPSVTLPHPDMSAGRSYARDLLSRGSLPSAIVAANDEVAFGVLAEIRAAGIHCPQDILITGYDDVPAAELLELTTVRQPLQEIGREAARLLTHESTAPRHLRLSPALITRATTQPAMPPSDWRPA